MRFISRRSFRAGTTSSHCYAVKNVQKLKVSQNRMSLSLLRFSRRSNDNNSNELTKLTIKQGWLHKKSKNTKTARKRWIVLNEGCLVSYKNDNTKRKPTESFNLKIYSQLKVTEQTHFELMPSSSKKSPSRVFIADNANELVEWITAIGKVQKKLVCSTFHIPHNTCFDL